MQHCTNCNKAFSYKQIFNSFWFKYKSIECESCKTKHEHTFRNRLLVGGSGGIAGGFGGAIAAYTETGLGLRLLISGISGAIILLLLLSIIVFYFRFEREGKKSYS